MPKDSFCLARKEDPACGIEAGEKEKQPDIQQPERLRDAVLEGNKMWHLIKRNGQDAGSHGHGKPVRGELADDLAGRGTRRQSRQESHSLLRASMRCLIVASKPTVSASGQIPG